MAIAYPSIPIPVVNGYAHPDSIKVRRNDAESGPPRIELLTVDGPSFPTVTWLFNALEFQVFEGWYKHELVFGKNSFNMSLSVGAGLKSHECRFDKTYTPALQGKRWKVTARLITVEKQYDTNGDYLTAKAALAAL